MKSFRGVMTPLLIPFDSEENIIEDELEDHIQILIEKGIHGILSPSSTGEFANLTQAKREQILEVTVKVVNKRIPVVALIGECGTRSTIQNIKKAGEIGADAVMATPPYYYPLDQRALEQHFNTLAEEGTLPLWLYHQPSDTKLSIDPETVQKLSGHPNIAGIKVSTNNLYYYQQVLRLIRPESAFTILFGEDHSHLPALSLGGDGMVSFLSNLIPDELIRLWNAAENLNIREARKIQQRISDVYNTVINVQTGSPWHAAKLILKKRGVFSANFCSSPFLPLEQVESDRLLKRAKELKLF